MFDFLHWYDWITPTSPSASLFFGLIFVSIAALFIWLDTKDKKSVFIASVTGIAVIIIGVYVLDFIHFY